MGFVDRRNRDKQSKEVEMYGRIHSDLFNVPQLMRPGVQLQISLYISEKNFYVLASKEDTTETFKFRDATL
jgi:hypothetical protein